MFVVKDGRDEIAIAFKHRARRYAIAGIKNFRTSLTNRYLKNIVPIRSGDVVINFGANVGEIALTLAEFGAKVLAIDPDPRHLTPLYFNTHKFGVELIPVAAWDSDCLLKLYLDDDDSADTSVINQTDNYIRAIGQRIDTIVEDRGIDRVRLIIGDAQGAEPEVLIGAAETLKITDYVSVCASAERRGERTLETCEAILNEASFNILHREEEKFCTLIGKNMFIPYEDVISTLSADSLSA